MQSKKVLVIGGTSGYGEGIAHVLSCAGHRVIAVGRSSELSLDITDRDQVKAFFTEVFSPDKPFDAVIYSAGLAIGKLPLHEKAAEDVAKVFETNTLGLAYVAKWAYPHLVKTQGHFIHMGSIAAYLNYTGGADYCASKSASNTIMKTLRHEWLGSGIRTTSMEIGLGNTNFQKNRYQGDSEKALKHTDGVRQLEPDEVGEFISYLLDAPDCMNFDEIILKPIDQASHGATVKNIKQQF
ncbi:SDR family oxidoreductase [Endozoicomonas sp. SESOKO1]|uniref:SDR family oxidoreductase n=1 Tax=Endozoicomonas sp. SESOKO1 TaxID=2828742 RepID=UPI0021498A66|nr:SDR family NAD(P)-dependent oxidoreductase [Endozoicomonas sp. SESOKO1]